MEKLITLIITIILFFYFFNEKYFNHKPKLQNFTIQENSIPKSTQKKYEIKKQNHNNYNFKEEIQNNRDALNNLFPANYIDRTLYNGYLIHWNPETFPLKVYIENNPELPEYFYENVKAAFDEWQNKTDNFINFVFVEQIENADIKCTFPKDFDKEINKVGGYIAGLTNLNSDNNKLYDASITFATTDSNNRYRSKRSIYLTATHEIGHALGIMGHSENEQDNMHPVSSKSQGLSIGDINTIKLLYSIVPDISNKPYTEEQKTKYITSKDIMGEYNTRINLELKNITDDLNIEGSAYSGKYFEKGNLYLKKQNYQLAIKYYKKGVETINNKDKQANIYNIIAHCYLKISDYDNAINYHQLSQSIKPNDDNTYKIAYIYYNKGNIPQARNMMINLINKNPKHYNAYLLLAKIYYETKNITELEKLYKKGKINFPNNPPLTKK